MAPSGNACAAVSGTPLVSMDIIGGFPVAEPNCKGCGKPLLLENAWMTDGCPCNSSLGVNSMNETRWRLLMQLQQQQSRALDESVKLQSHYAKLLNVYAGGERMTFATAKEWVDRLETLEK